MVTVVFFVVSIGKLSPALAFIGWLSQPIVGLGKRRRFVKFHASSPPPYASCPPLLSPYLRGGPIPPSIKNLKGKPWGSMGSEWVGGGGRWRW